MMILRRAKERERAREKGRIERKCRNSTTLRITNEQIFLPCQTRLDLSWSNPGGAMKWIAGIFSLFSLFFPLFCNASDAPVGSVNRLKGTASIIRQNQVIPAQVGEKIYRMDLLKTGRDGFLGVIFKDDTLLSIGPQSEIIISEFLFSPAEGKLSMVTKLLKGTAIYLTGIIGKLSPGSVRFETPVANIGIRGTKFAVKVEDSPPGTP